MYYYVVKLGCSRYYGDQVMVVKLRRVDTWEVGEGTLQLYDGEISNL